MINLKIFNVFIFLLAVFICIGALSSNAQEPNKVKTLDEILNPVTEKEIQRGPITAITLSNDYYAECIDKKSMVFNEKEKEILCSCNAAKMSETLTIQDFKNFKDESRIGKDARMKMLTYAYAPCMLHVIESKATYECYASGMVDDLVKGKKLICGCVADKYRKFIEKGAPHIIMNAVYFNPMTMDPLEDYFIERSSLGQTRLFVKQCRFKYEFNRDNKK